MRNLPNLDGEIVERLSQALFRAVDVRAKGAAETLYAALALKEWMMLKGMSGEEGNRRQEILTLARGHLEVWLMRGVSAEMYHLKRSKQLYAEYFEQFAEYGSVKDMVDRFRVLMFLGELHAAEEIIVNVLTNYETDPNISNHMFYAGVVYKALKNYEKANSYLFDSIQAGPPRYFSQIEIMTIISRNLEEAGEGDMEEENEDAYRMVQCLTYKCLFFLFFFVFIIFEFNYF